MAFKPADRIQDLQYFGEFGGVNPSISDSSTYTFLSAKTMFDTFEGNAEGCYLYSRHSTPSNLYLGQALAAMEGTETANVAASGMGAIILPHNSILKHPLWILQSWTKWKLPLLRKPKLSIVKV